MNGAAEHLTSIKARIVAHPQVVRWTVVREEAQGDQGLFRYRLTLRGGDLCERFERFQVVAGSVRVSTYAFHWQDAAGQLRKRWDNAAHHPEISTHPQPRARRCRSKRAPSWANQRRRSADAHCRGG